MPLSRIAFYLLMVHSMAEAPAGDWQTAPRVNFQAIPLEIKRFSAFCQVETIPEIRFFPFPGKGIHFLSIFVNLTNGASRRSQFVLGWWVSIRILIALGIVSRQCRLTISLLAFLYRFPISFARYRYYLQVPSLQRAPTSIRQRPSLPISTAACGKVC